MFKNYFKTAFRNLMRRKAYSFLNIAGLALGIGCSLVIYKVITFEKSFDTHQSNYDSIYRVVHEHTRPDGVDKGMGTPHPVGTAIREDYPEIRRVARTHYVWSAQINIQDGVGTKKFLLEEGVAFVENDFFHVFDLDFVAGDRRSVLIEPNSVVLAKSECRRLLGLEEGQESEAMGEVISYAGRGDFKVVGVIEDPQEATNFPFTILFEYTSQGIVNRYYHDGKEWNSTSSSTNTYLLVDQAFDQKDFDAKLVDLIKKYYDEEEIKTRRFVTQPLASVHFDDEYGNYTYTSSDQVILALTIIAVFLVLTACINFVNLATAQAANRSKEIGIRKAIGGYTGQLIGQFFAEIAVISFMALLISIAVSEFMFVQLEEVIGTRLQLDLLNDVGTISFLLILFVTVSFLSGFYPSLLLSRMNTVLALKNKITAKNHSGGLNLRKMLVIAQFTISQFLIIGTVIISAQMKYFSTKDLGFNQEAIVKTYLPERDVNRNERFRHLMLGNSSVADITFALSSPTGNSESFSNFNYAPLDSQDDYDANFKCVDERYMEVFGLKLLAGRGFHKNDSSDYLIINEKTAKLMGFKDRYDEVIGEVLTTGWGGDKKIIGVMNDFHSGDLSRDLDFVFLMYEPDVYFEIAFKLEKNADIRAAIDHFEASWEKVYPEAVIDWQFYDEELAENYEQEENLASLMNTFTLISILIGSLGLYGLIAFIAANRTKEVGIRKVLGASVLSILQGFTKEVIVLIAIAFVIAAPVSYFILDQWLENYKFRIDIGFQFFIIAFIGTLVVALLTVSHRTVATALMNPAKTLKDE